MVMLVSVLSLISCGREKPADGVCGDEKEAVFEIIGGAAGLDPAVAPLADAQVDAVGFVEIDGRYACTGTLVAPMTVLTAAHCLRMDPAHVIFRVGPDWRSATRSYDALSWQLHPGYAVGEVDHDLAVILLAGDPAADGVAPIPVRLSPVQSLQGQNVQAVGYGFTRDGDNSNSSRWWVVLNISRETTAAYIASGDGTTGTCDGDSGGPLLWAPPAGQAGVYAALSLGEAHTACLGDSWYTRLDDASNAAFVPPYLPADPCEGETRVGRCASAARAVYCVDGVLHDETCGAGQACGTGADGNNRCLTLGPCEAEGLDRAGTCTADGHARWCEEGRVMDRDCPLCGQACGWAGDELGYYCL